MKILILLENLKVSTLSIFQNVLHYFLHFGFPFVIAYLFRKEKWLIAGTIMFSTIIIDVDHFWANPIFDACRCSIGYHPFHSMPIITLYPVLLFFPKTRLLGIGLTIHILTDCVDCLIMKLNC